MNRNTSFARNVFGTQAGWGTVPLRLAAGIIFAAHGAQKLFGWFGGYGLAGTAGWLDSIGLGPGVPMALLAGGAEFFGGLALLAGFLVRPVSAVLAFVMAVAIFAVHWGKGLFVANNGYEFALALFAMTVALAFSGAGAFSADRALAPQPATQR